MRIFSKDLRDNRCLSPDTTNCARPSTAASMYLLSSGSAATASMRRFPLTGWAISSSDATHRTKSWSEDLMYLRTFGYLSERRISAKMADETTSSKELLSSKLVRIRPDAPFGWIRALMITLASRTARSTAHRRRALRVRCLASFAMRSACASAGFSSWRSRTRSRCIRAARRICSNRSTGTTAASGLPLRSIMNWSLRSATRLRIAPSRWRTCKVEIFSVIVTTIICVNVRPVKPNKIILRQPELPYAI
jgi:hypothetical protein